MKRSTSILLYVLLPLFWALVLALGFFIYTFNQDPVGLARSLSARFSAPEAGCKWLQMYGSEKIILGADVSCRRIKLRSPSFRVRRPAFPA